MNIRTSSSTENTCPWATLKFMPSDLRASVVTQPGALVLSPLVALSGSDKPLGMQDGNSFGLNLKASWGQPDQLHQYQNAFPFLQLMWPPTAALLERRVHQLRCIYPAEMPLVKAFSEYYTNADYREVGNLRSEVAFKLPLFIFSSDVQASLQLLAPSVLCSNQICSSVYL